MPIDITAFVASNRSQRDLVTLRKHLARQSKKLGRTSPQWALLLKAERAYAQAMYMRETHSEDPNGRITGSTRSHIVSRLHKAARYARDLAKSIEDGNASDAGVVEAQAYARSLEGSEEFEKQSVGGQENPKAAWRPCLERFSESFIAYSALLHAEPRKEAYKEIIASVVEPSIRFAAYRSRLPRSIPIASLAKQHFRQNERDLRERIERLDPSALSEQKARKASTSDGKIETDIPTTVSWRGRTAQISDASIGQALAATELAARELPKSMSESKSRKALATAYDPILIAAQDAVDNSRRAVTELSKEGVSESDSRMQDLRVVDLYANYALISWRVGRNRILLSDSKTSGSQLDDGISFPAPQNVRTKVRRRRKDASNGSKAAEKKTKSESRSHKLARLRERAVLFDAILQSLDSIKALRGAARDTDFIAELDTQRAYFQALKCLNVGYGYSLLSKRGEALALFARALNVLSSGSISALKQTDSKSVAAPKLDVSAIQFQNLQSQLQIIQLRQHGLVTLFAAFDSADAANKDSHSSGSVVAKLDEYPASGKVDLKNIVKYPPTLEAVPVKPVFLDLAFNYIEFPSGPGAKSAGQNVGAAKSTPAKAHEEVKDEPKKRGWFGFGR